MILPPKLRRGDAVRVVAPSSPYDPAALDRGLEVLSTRFGLEPRMRADLGTRRGYLAGDDARRAEEWREAVADPDSRAIFCARGGYGAMRILPAVDPAPLLARPKALVGFSDVTALHAVLNRAGLASVHGPVVTQLGRAPEDALRHLEALLLEDAPRAGPWEVPAPGAGLVASRTVSPGRASGPLLGGTLTLLAHLAGTPYAPRLDGAILLLEDVGEKPYRIDRCLTQLRLAGALDRIAGLAIGLFTSCDDAGILGSTSCARWRSRSASPPSRDCPSGTRTRTSRSRSARAPPSSRRRPGEEGPPRLLFDEWSARPRVAV